MLILCFRMTGAVAVCLRSLLLKALCGTVLNRRAAYHQPYDLFVQSLDMEKSYVFCLFTMFNYDGVSIHYKKCGNVAHEDTRRISY